MRETDFLIVGGGIVGTSVAYGLAREGLHVTVLDGSDTDLRAARANFGLVWTQSKGLNMPAYQRWSRRSADLWTGFADTLASVSGIAVDYRKSGGLTFCLGEGELDRVRAAVRRMGDQLAPGEYDCRILDRRELDALLPRMRLGPAVVGAAFCPHDGDANPLLLLKALTAAIARLGGAVCPNRPVRSIRYDGNAFWIEAAGEEFVAARVVIAAGNGTAALASQVGLDVPIRPERGQILVTERMEPVFPYTASGIRQTFEGTFMIGATHEDAGLDVSTRVPPAATIARRAVSILPALRGVRIVRNWAGLRVLTPDVCPVYAASETHPGAFVAACHSGVTLAAVHATDLAGALVAGSLPPTLAPFHPRRFHVPQTA